MTRLDVMRRRRHAAAGHDDPASITRSAARIARGIGLAPTGSEQGMTEFIIQLTAATAADADRIGPKAANLAALTHAGLPTPGGFCLSAQAYRAQIAALGLAPLIRRFANADIPEQRRLSV